jgi:pre-mRNA-processing factor 39
MREADQNLDDVLQELRKRVEADVTDFDAWTQLVSTCEKLDDPEKLRSAYQDFVAEYPLFHAYWERYSSATGRFGGDPAAIFEQGVAAIPYSVNLWVQYAQHLIASEAPSEKVTETFERGLGYVSTHFLSHPLWDKYIEYQLHQQATASVSEIYARILRSSPNQQLERYLASFKEYVATRTIYELMQASEIEQERAKLAAAAPSQTKEEGGEEEGDATKLSEDDKIKRNWMAPKLAACESTKRKRETISPFEDSVKGSHHFHVYTLDKGQLSNWNRYLDYEEKEGDLASVTTLYERCLISCASYPAFWIRYALYIESQPQGGGDLTRVCEILDRATKTHTKRKPECHLWKARFDERRGEIEACRSGYQHLLKDVAPNLLQGIVAYANLERRQGSVESASKVFQDALESTKERASEGSSSTTFAYIAIHYARFVQHVKKDIEKARGIYEYALGIAPHQRILWESYVLLETYAKQEEDLNTKVGNIFKRALATESMSVEDKEQLSLHSLEYTDLLGSREELSAVQSTHWKMFRGSAQASEEAKDSTTSNKRALETDLTSAPKRMIPAPPPNANGASAVPVPKQQHYQHHPSYEHQAQQDYYGNGQANYDYSQQQQQAYSNYYQGYYQQQQ